MENLQQKQEFFELLNERQKRLFAAMEANSLGRSGVRLVSEGLGLHPNTIRKGQKELTDLQSNALTPAQVRKVGGGRKKRL